jgi:hypothetical protein
VQGKGAVGYRKNCIRQGLFGSALSVVLGRGKLPLFLENLLVFTGVNWYLLGGCLGYLGFA